MQPNEDGRICRRRQARNQLLDSAPAAEVPSPLPDAWSATGTVIRVVDGDTIVVDVNGLWETVRLIGIDTPEIVDPRKPIQPFAQDASDFAKRDLDGRKVTLVADPGNAHIGHRDRYGRVLAYVWLGDVLFNERIIREGFAHAYTKYPFRQDYMDRFRQAEMEAREAARGLWSSVATGEKLPDAEGGM